MKKHHLKIQVLIITLLIICFSNCQKYTFDHITKLTTDKIQVSNSKFIATGTIIDISNSGITSFGHCWSTNPNPTINDNKTTFTNATTGYQFISTIPNLTENTNYYVCSYAISKQGITYGNILNFNSIQDPYPTISISNPNIINGNTASATLNITRVGSVTITNYGLCWASNPYPSILNNRTQLGELQNNYSTTTTFTPLQLDTTYYVRGYLSLGAYTTIYSKSIPITIPNIKITTDTASVPTTNMATFQGTIENLGVYPITDHGICWSTTTSNPDYNSNKITLGTATKTGPFYANLNITPGNTYYYVAYAIANDKVKYGIIKKIKY